jgi:hypothetical protein
VAFRVVLLILAATAVVVGAAIAFRDRTGADAGARYACPMHPEVMAAEPGQCPICRMALEPIGREAPSGGAHGNMGDMTAVENVRKHNIIEFVRMKSLLPDLREMRGAAWVEPDGMITAVFYNDQIDSLAADEPGSFSLADSPEITFPVRRTADSAIHWDASTSRIRFRLDTGRVAPNPAPGPGRTGWLEVARKPREVMAVPASAVVQSPEGPYVLLSTASGAFEKRPIAIGETFIKQGFAVVLSGLRANDRVVARATFFLDADRKLAERGGEKDWAVH